MSPELKKLACRQAGPTIKAELEVEEAWQTAVMRYDKFFMDSQQKPTAATDRISLRLELIDEFTARRVWPETARQIVDECIFGAKYLELAS